MAANNLLLRLSSKPGIRFSASSNSRQLRRVGGMLEGKAIVGETDMLQAMQQDALDLAAKALDRFDVNGSD
ncbi:hypothetical protein SDJN02_22878, partial [Cucurbita argyrosperma subsp. argyrosperma]